MGRKSVAVEVRAKRHEQGNKGRSEHVCLYCDEVRQQRYPKELEEKFLLKSKPK